MSAGEDKKKKRIAKDQVVVLMLLFSLQNSTHQPHSSATENMFSMNFKNSGIEIFFSNGKLTS